MALSKQFRSPSSPSPIYGLRPGFNVGDIERQYTRYLGVYGTFDTTSHLVTAQTSTADAVGTVVSPKCRSVKISINVTGTGSVDITAKSAGDAFAATIFDSGNLAQGTYEFFLGGWSSPSGDSVNGTYIATQYGPVKIGQTPSASNPTGDQETSASKVNISADSNYVGGAYNPVLFLSLDGLDLKFFSVKTGTASWDVEVTEVS